MKLQVLQGFKIALNTLDYGRAGIAAQAVGIAQGLLDATVELVRQRSRDGVPLTEDQGVAFALADMAMEVTTDDGPPGGVSFRVMTAVGPSRL